MVSNWDTESTTKLSPPWEIDLHYFPHKKKNSLHRENNQKKSFKRVYIQLLGIAGVLLLILALTLTLSLVLTNINSYRSKISFLIIVDICLFIYLAWNDCNDRTQSQRKKKSIKISHCRIFRDSSTMIIIHYFSSPSLIFEDKTKKIFWITSLFMIFDARVEKKRERERKRSCGTKKKGKLSDVYLFSNNKSNSEKVGERKKNMTRKVNRLWSRKMFRLDAQLFNVQSYRFSICLHRPCLNERKCSKLSMKVTKILLWKSMKLTMTHRNRLNSKFNSID